MTRLKTWVIAMALTGTGCTSTAPVDPGSGAEPEACEAGAATALGTWMHPMGAPPIVHTPAGALDADATVVSVDTGASLLIVLDVEGAEHRIEIVGPAEDPGLTVGQHVGVVLATEPGLGDESVRETLTLRAEDGAPLALYTRGRSGGPFDAPSLLSETFDVTASTALRCRLDGGGQCGRGIIVRELVLGAVRLSEGETMVVAAGGGELRVAVHALADDSDDWFDGTACAISVVLSESVDVVALP